MRIEEVLVHCDHTLLRQDATWPEIKQICNDGIRYHCASVCIPPSYVKAAAEYAAGKLKICTVIGFPNGYATTNTKVFETKDAVANGADEIDMVINLGWVKDQRWEDLLSEMKAVKAACGDRILKVIVETCLLTQEEKIKLCELVSASGAAYIKTSTGFSTGGAKAEDIALFRQHLSGDMKIKASGGVRTLEQAVEMIDAGADRIGASALVKIANG